MLISKSLLLSWEIPSRILVAWVSYIPSKGWLPKKLYNFKISKTNLISQNCNYLKHMAWMSTFPKCTFMANTALASHTIDWEFFTVNITPLNVNSTMINMWILNFNGDIKTNYKSVVLALLDTELDGATEGVFCSWRLSNCWVTSPTHRQLTSSWGLSGSLQWGHWERCSTSHRRMQAKQQSFEQCGHNLASLNLSMQIKHLNTSAIPWKPKDNNQIYLNYTT